MLDALFEGGCNLFCVDYDNRTLLAVAAAQNHLDSTSFLCEIDDDQVRLIVLSWLVGWLVSCLVGWFVFVAETADT